MSTWVTAESIPAGVWPDAANLEPAALELLLDAAEESCAAYAPALADGATVPRRYVMAVILHARDLVNAARRDPGGMIGPDGLTLTPRPLSGDVRQLLRPRTGVPAFGHGS